MAIDGNCKLLKSVFDNFVYNVVKVLPHQGVFAFLVKTDGILSHVFWKIVGMELTTKNNLNFLPFFQGKRTEISVINGSGLGFASKICAESWRNDSFAFQQ